MTCNAAAVRVNSLEAWDQSKQDWALSLSLHFSSLSAEAWASLVLSLSLSLHNSSLHISLAWASNLTQCTPWKICSDPPLSSFPYFAHSWCLKELGATGSAGKLRRCVGKEILFFLSLVLSNFPNKLSPDSPTPCLVSAWVLIFFPFSLVLFCFAFFFLWWIVWYWADDWLADYRCRRAKTSAVVCRKAFTLKENDGMMSAGWKRGPVHIDTCECIGVCFCLEINKCTEHLRDANNYVPNSRSKKEPNRNWVN